MKKIRRAAALSVLTVVLAVGGVSAIAAQGSQEDPLVTLSYLNQVVTPQLESKVESAVKENAQTLSKELNDAISDYEQRVSETLAGAGASNRFVSRTLSQGESLTPGAGREVLILSGNAVAAGTLSDTTAGKSVNDGSSLESGHLYVTLSEDSGVSAKGNVTCMWR